MKTVRALAAMTALIALCVPALARQVAAPGSRTTYPAEVEAEVGKKSVAMKLTGTAMRQKVIINVYAIGSYIDSAAKAKTADDLVAADCAKRLQLVMERNVTGADMAAAFTEAIRKNHAEPAFTDEVGVLARFMKSTSLRKGEQITLTHVPGAGLHCNVAGKADFTIDNPAFSRAVWEIYLGKNNVGEAVKRGLTSRL